jgi:ribonuclease J
MFAKAGNVPSLPLLKEKDGLGEAQTGEHLAEVATLRDSIHDSVTAYLYERTKRRPMVLPVIMQV